MKRKFSLSILAAWGLVMTQLYQNCAPLNIEGFTVLSSEELHMTDTGMSSHPTSEKQSDLPMQKQLVVPKTYVASLMRQVFTSTTFPVTNLEVLIDKWIMLRGAQYGGACNIYSSYSSRDCAGSVANTNLDVYADDNTVRESFRIQMCENVLGQDKGVSAALEKVGLTVTSSINADSLILAYKLFYRANPPEPLVVSTLLELNKSLVAEKATLLNQWRATLSQICESPGWQLL